MGLKDIRIPADASDKQTTDAKSAVPPVDFSITGSVSTFFQISIKDRQWPQERKPTSSYRIYFLPDEVAPRSTGTTVTVPPPVVYKTAERNAGRRVAELMGEIQAPGLGTVLSSPDLNNILTRTGWYFCVAVNRLGIEAPCEHMVHTP